MEVSPADDPDQRPHPQEQGAPDEQADPAAAGCRRLPPWEEIVEKHSARVYRLAYRLTGNGHDAEDLTQEVFVRVFRSLHTYTPGTMEGWLHRITTNLFLDSARRKQRIRFDALSDEAASRLPSALPTPDVAHWTACSTPTSRPHWPRSPPTSAPRWCSATSRASPTRRSPTSWA